MSQIILASDIGAGLQIVAGKLVAVLATQSQTIGYTWAAAKISANGATLHSVDHHDSSTNPLFGRYTIVFDQPHPNGDEYSITLSVEEDTGNRDGRIIQIVAGSQTAAGFDVMILTGDNGTAADPYTEEDWSYSVSHEISVITGVSLV